MMNKKGVLINKWEMSGHLDGISGLTKDSVVKFYECEAVQLLREKWKNGGK